MLEVSEKPLEGLGREGGKSVLTGYIGHRDLEWKMQVFETSSKG